MKLNITFIFLLVLISCTKTQKTEKDIITRFENSLGKLETKYLDEMVDDFDTFLSKKFNNKNSESNFKLYLKELSNSDKPDIWNTDSLKLKQYLTSKLFAKYDSIYPDSVWIENDMINLKFKEKEVIQSIIPINKTDLHSMINELKTEPELNLTEPSNFYNALKLVADKDSLILNYLSYREIAGKSSTYLLASGLLYDYKNDSEYFAKRILIMEMNE